MNDERNINTVQAEYSQAVSDLGVESYKRWIAAQEIEKADYSIEKLQNKIRALNNEGAKLMAAKSNAEVVLPEAPKETSNVEAGQ